jgi:heptaprenyl diphosphate synthase
MRKIALKKTRKLVLLALFTAQAIVLSIVESWLPIPAAVPGVKLGLANIITLSVIIFFGFREAIAVVIVRTVLVSFYAGGPMVFLFSAAGGILSTAAMAVLYSRMSRIFSIIGVSIAGAIMHNLGQLIMASFVMKEVSVLLYLPILIVSGIIMGCFVGLCTNFLVKALKKTNIF